MSLKAIIIGVLIVLALVIFFQNSHAVSFHLLFWDIQASLVILLPLALVLGFVAGYVTHAMASKSGRKENGGSRKP